MISNNFRLFYPKTRIIDEILLISVYRSTFSKYNELITQRNTLKFKITGT